MTQSTSTATVEKKEPSSLAELLTEWPEATVLRWALAGLRKYQKHLAKRSESSGPVSVGTVTRRANRVIAGMDQIALDQLREGAIQAELNKSRQTKE